TLARLNIYVLLPALVLSGIYDTTLNLSSALGIVAGFLINTALLFALAVGCARVLKFSVERRKSLIATTVFANVGNLGLPFVLFTLGEAGFERAIVYLVASALAIASVFPIVLKGEGLRSGLAFTLKLPVLWATLAGLIMQWIAWYPPQSLSRGIELLSDAAIPIALLTLGIQLAQTRLAFGWHELFGSGLRLIASPLLAYGVGSGLGLTGLDLQVLVVQAAMPVAVNSLIWVMELGGNREQVAKTIVLSTVMSMVTLPLILWLSVQV
ncbi:transporter, partial [filamentous cyanobacterium CCP5]